MLKQLYISNFTLIDTLDIKFNPGFSVITGETGAGKSIILGAIGLLLGQRADTKAIKTGSSKCVIEAHFDLSRYGLKDFFDNNDIEYDDTDCIIRRELAASGKSRAFINDTPVALALLKELGEKLIDVHSQHQNLLIGKQDFQLDVVDIIAGNGKDKAVYASSYAHFQDLNRRLAELKSAIERDRANADFLQFQFDELSNANLSDGEQEELERKSDAMSHAEDIKRAFYEADNVLSADGTGVVESLKSASSALHSIGKVLPSAEEMAGRMDSCYIELKDISGEIGSCLEDIDFNPSELDSVNARLDTIYGLQKKYHCDTVAELIARRDELGSQLSHIENSDEELAAMQAELEKVREECRKQAGALSASRQKAAKTVEKSMLTQLRTLGMPNVRFEVAIEQGDLTPSGFDRVAFLFSANTSTTLQPVEHVASGGEVARVMLSLKAMISGAIKLPTIIFDEIDTGVSGKIAEQMAQIMQQMGQADRQVICITHLPQIAALGTTHYKVYKTETSEGTTSRMQQLSDDERVREIAQMLSGSDVTEAAISNAKELLKK